MNIIAQDKLLKVEIDALMHLHNKSIQEQNFAMKKSVQLTSSNFVSLKLASLSDYWRIDSCNSFKFVQFSITKPDFFNAYKNARNIIDYSGRGKGKKEQTTEKAV